jgi:IMP cyclohydrolase
MEGHMSIEAAAKANMDALRANVYPGRGIVIGQTPDAKHLVQVYWIMGRSENSRNRIFVAEGDVVRTAPYDASKVEDPSLIIYNCVRTTGRAHIVSNGNQTDTILEALESGGTFEGALFTREFEPDDPNYTPRISGLIGLDDGLHAYKLSILKTIGNDPARGVRLFYNYAKAIPGIGHFVATYSGDGSPLPAFDGEPQPVEIAGDIDAVLDAYWAALNDDNKVSLLVKFIDPATDETDVRIANKHKA